VMNVQGRFDAFHETASRLAEVRVSREQVRALTEILIPKEEDVRDTRRARARAQIMAAYEDGPQNLPSIRGTAWAMFNAVTQFVDHDPLLAYKGKRADPRAKLENRFQSVIMGANAAMKQSALNLVGQMVAAV